MPQKSDVLRPAHFHTASVFIGWALCPSQPWLKPLSCDECFCSIVSAFSGVIFAVSCELKPLEWFNFQPPGTLHRGPEDYPPLQSSFQRARWLTWVRGGQPWRTRSGHRCCPSSSTRPTASSRGEAPVDIHRVRTHSFPVSH